MNGLALSEARGNFGGTCDPAESLPGSVRPAPFLRRRAPLAPEPDEPAWRRTIEGLFGLSAGRANYLCNFSVKYNYVYLENPKVACTTIKRVLARAEVKGDESRLPVNVHDRAALPIPRLLSKPDLFCQVWNRPDSFWFSFVRNPYTRVLSCYLDKIVTNAWERGRLAPKLGFGADTVPSFLEFLRAVERQPGAERDTHWATQTHLLRRDSFAWDFIGRFEFFRDQFPLVCERLGIVRYLDLSDVGHATGATARRKEFLGPREVELIARIYADDFLHFGYGWSPDIV